MKNLAIISIAPHLEWKDCSRCSLVAVVITASALDLPDQLRLNPATTNALHHCEMLQVVMCLEKGITSEELDEDAANAPNIAWIAPSQIKYDFWCSVVPCRNNGRMVLVIKSCGPKVNKSDLGVKQDSPLACDTLHCGR